MFIWTMDCGWEGSIVVIANTEEEARVLMADKPNYMAKRPVENHEIKQGFVFYNTGDL